MAEKKLKREFEYKLQNPISLHKGGERVFANKVLMKAPSIVQMRERCIIKHCVMDTMKKLSDENQNKQRTGAQSAALNIDDLSPDESGAFKNQIVSLMTVHQSATAVEETMNAFINILKSSATIDSEKINDVLINQIDCEDMEALIGEYIVNFILPSWMKRDLNI